MAGRIGLLLEPPSLQAQAGGEAAAVLTVENRSTIVDQYAVSIEGLEPSWYTLSSAVAGLFPGEKGQVQVSFHPPRAMDVRAGTFSFSVKASSLASPEEFSTVEGSLEVLPFGASAMEMSPQQLAGRRGVTQLLVRNQSNAPALLNLQATDLEEGLEYRFSTDTVSIPAAGETTVSLTIRPKKRPLFGESHEYPFRVVALEPEQPPEEATMVAEGTFTYQPRLAGVPKALGALWRKLRPVLPLLLSLVALALALFALLKPPPTVETPEPPAPPPVIQSFRSEPGPGGSIQLKWQVTGAREALIDGKLVDATQGTLQVDHPENKEYVLEASNEGGTVTQRLGIVLLRPPTIATFEASPTSVSSGGSTMLSWKVENATRVLVDGEPVPEQDMASGKREVKPDQTRDYVLIAENEVGWVVRRVTVQVQ